MPSAVEECGEPSGNRQGISHFLESGPRVIVQVIVCLSVCLSRCLSVCHQTFQIATPSSYSFCLVLTKLSSRDLCTIVQEKLWNRFSKLLF